MATCKCGSIMHVSGDYMLCPTCGHRYELPYKALSHEEALKEVARLKLIEVKYHKAMEAIINHEANEEEFQDIIHEFVE